jgi:hypothetical protein
MIGSAVNRFRHLVDLVRASLFLLLRDLFPLGDRVCCLHVVAPPACTCAVLVLVLLAGTNRNEVRDVPVLAKNAAAIPFDRQ